MTGRDVLMKLGARPVALEAKEGLALINGTHFMAGIGALAAIRAERALSTANIAAALTLEALRGASAAFDPRVHTLRPVPGQILSAQQILEAIRGS